MRKTLVLLVTIGAAATVCADTFDDIIVYRGPGSWFLSHNPGSPDYYQAPGVGAAPVTSQLSGYGAAGNVPLVGDVNGDGIDDVVAVQDGFNTIFVSSHSSIGAGGVGALGAPATSSTANGLGLPAGRVGQFLADINGDGFADAVAVDSGFNFRTSFSSASGLSLNQDSFLQWGGSGFGDTPLMGDFDGDGKTDAALYRTSGANDWYVNKSTATTIGGGGTAISDFGIATDSPLVGDFNGDGRDDGIVVRVVGNELRWLAGFSDTTGAVAGDGISNWASFGLVSAGDVPIVADINGDGMSDIGVKRGGQYLFAFTEAGGVLTSGADDQFNFGFPTDTPLFGDFDVVPEPATLGMLAIGGVFVWIRRKFMA